MESISTLLEKRVRKGTHVVEFYADTMDYVETQYISYAAATFWAKKGRWNLLRMPLKCCDGCLSCKLRRNSVWQPVPSFNPICPLDLIEADLWDITKYGVHPSRECLPISDEFQRGERIATSYTNVVMYLPHSDFFIDDDYHDKVEGMRNIKLQTLLKYEGVEGLFHSFNKSTYESFFPTPKPQTWQDTLSQPSVRCTSLDCMIFEDHS